jgi:lysyl-tRNA synthetase class 2
MSERLEDIIAFRKAKIDTLRAQGIEPYPSSTKRSHTIEQVLADFDQLMEKELTIAGRIRSLRTMGKLAFAHVEDGSARMQVLIKSDVAARRS